MHDALLAVEQGSEYKKEGAVVIPAGAQGRKLDPDLALAITRAAGMKSNIISVTYDATAVSARISWERGNGKNWEAANAHEYLNVDLKALFDLIRKYQ